MNHMTALPKLQMEHNLTLNSSTEILSRIINIRLKTRFCESLAFEPAAEATTKHGDPLDTYPPWIDGLAAEGAWDVARSNRLNERPIAEKNAERDGKSQLLLSQRNKRSRNLTEN